MGEVGAEREGELGHEFIEANAGDRLEIMSGGRSAEEKCG